MRCFGLFSKTTPTISFILGQDVEEIDTDKQEKTRLKYALIFEIFIFILGKTCPPSVWRSHTHSHTLTYTHAYTQSLSQHTHLHLTLSWPGQGKFTLPSEKSLSFLKYLSEWANFLRRFSFYLLDAFPENFSFIDGIERKLQRISQDNVENARGLFSICIGMQEFANCSQFPF